MRKYAGIIILSLILVTFSASCAVALARIPTLEVTGIFEKIDATVDPRSIVLIVDGKEASGPLGESCVFRDEKNNEVDRDTFVRLYLKRIITVELIESTGVVVACRVGS